jgi:hypothetical protein
MAAQQRRAGGSMVCRRARGSVAERDRRTSRLSFSARRNAARDKMWMIFRTSNGLDCGARCINRGLIRLVHCRRVMVARCAEGVEARPLTGGRHHDHTSSADDRSGDDSVGDRPGSAVRPGRKCARRRPPAHSPTDRCRQARQRRQTQGRVEPPRILRGKATRTFGYSAPILGRSFVSAAVIAWR